MRNIQYTNIKPFLRWAGGKSKIVKQLAQYLPPTDSFDRYYEPFLGAGALFFYLGPDNAMLSDANVELINCYIQVSKDPTSVWLSLQFHRNNSSKEYYYRVRAQRIEDLNPVERAARFIYLNKSAFNGIYRVNKRGVFNVPYGPSSNGPALPDKNTLIKVSETLCGATLKDGDYREACRLAGKHDFVYLDPPYPPLNNTSNFNHYTSERFSWDDQIEVAEVYQALDKKQCYVMISNIDCDRIRSVYAKYNIYQLDVTRWLGANGKRFQVQELVITNYQPIKNNTNDISPNFE